MLGVNISILQNGKILLTKREDFEVWCLPGGAVDEGESLAQAAIREAREETGLEVELTRLVGLYSRSGWPGAGVHIVSFIARPIGGELRADPSEVIEMSYFGPDEIPEDLLWWHKQRIEDAFSGIGGGIVRAQTVDYPFECEITRAEMYRLRDKSGLSRRDFYFETLGKMTNAQERLEISPDKIKETAI
jgi:ADP-ribose pyrophosphatase YjhB (NUDIX family)